MAHLASPFVEPTPVPRVQERLHRGSYRARSIARDATSMRQSAEWGMRAFQSSMPRI